MKTLGLIGGMSWESTTSYYQWINQGIQQRLGGLHSASLLLHSVDFSYIEALQQQSKWDEAGRYLAQIACQLEIAGAEAILLCTNTMHKVAADIEAKINVPFLHIADITAQSIADQNICRVALLGTAFTMQQDFYKQRLQRYGHEVITPQAADMEIIHSIIYQELCVGVIRETSKQQYLEIIQKLIDQGAQAVIFGCTEIGLLINQDSVAVPVFDSAELHAAAAVDFALN